MKKFTYYDYLRYRAMTFELKDRQEEYRLQKGVHQYKDKGYKIILENKGEVVQIINKALALQNTQYAISKDDIVKYNSSFITRDFRAQEADIVYQKIGEDVFFLIEQQSQVDYSMSYRMLNYCIEIIRSAIDKKKLKNKEYEMPVVYPIVLYTGKRKWNAKTYFEESQKKMKGVQKNNFTSYNLIDINEYEEDDLWEQENFLAKLLLLEKAKESGKVKEYLNRMGKVKLKDEEISILIRFLYSSLDTKIEEEQIQKFAEQVIKDRKEGGYMLTVLEEYFISLIDEGLKSGIKKGVKKGIREGRQKGIREGRQKGIQEGMEKGIQEGKESGKLEILKQTVTNMLKFGEKDETIMKYIGIEKEELENIKGMI